MGRQRLGLATMALFAVAVTGCDDDDEVLEVGPDITFDQLQDIVDGPTRIEATVRSDTLVAREIDIEDDDELDDEERVEAAVTAINVDPVTEEGTLTLAVGDLQIFFTPATDFEDKAGFFEEPFGIDDDLDFDEFVDEITDELAEGDRPRIVAIRDAPAVPQDPTDDTFFASEIRIEDGDEDALPRFVVNIGPENLETVTNPPPAGIIRIFDLPIQVVEGVTFIDAEDIEDVEDVTEVDVRGMADRVDVDQNRIVLTDGTVVVVDGDTEFILDDDSDLGSLEALEAVLDQDRIVEVRAEGELLDSDPVTVRADRLELDLGLADDEPPMDDPPGDDPPADDPPGDDPPADDPPGDDPPADDPPGDDPPGDDWPDDDPPADP